MSRKELFPQIETEQLAYATAIEVAKEASNLVLKYWPNPNNPKFKHELTITNVKNEGIGNFATIADEKSEDYIKKALQAVPQFEHFGFRGEESKPEISDSPYEWVVDPIDGTTVFSNGIPDFGVMIALMKENEPLFGVISLPAHNRIISAFKSKGILFNSLQNNESLKLSIVSNRELARSVVVYDIGYSNREEQTDHYVKKILQHVAAPVSYYSSSFSNFRVATGHVAAYFSKEPKIFDITPAAVIIEELGGKVSQMDGNPIDWKQEKNSYLAAITPQIHNELLTILNS